MRELAFAVGLMVAVAVACGGKSNSSLSGGAVGPSTPCMRDADCGADMRCNTCPPDPACPACDVCGPAVCEPVR